MSAQAAEEADSDRREQEGMVRVVVVDDQPLFRRAAVALVRSVPGLDVVGEAESGEQGVAMAFDLQPGLILMDIKLPGIDGVEATRRILADRPSTRVVLVSTYDARDLPADYLRCGAVAFVRKQDLDPDALLGLAVGRNGSATDRIS